MAGRSYQFAVIGLGAFGSDVARWLAEHDHYVIAIDRDAEDAKPLRDVCRQVVVADATDSNVLAGLGLEQIDAAVVGIGTDIGASNLVVLHLREIGVKRIVAKAVSRTHEKLLHYIGAHEVVVPERDMAIRTAEKIATPSVHDVTRIGGNVSVVELDVPHFMEGKTILDCDIRNNYKVLIAAVRRPNGETEVAPNIHTPFEGNERLIVIGDEESVARFEQE